MKNFIFIFIAFAIILSAGCATSERLMPEGTDYELLPYCRGEITISSDSDGNITTTCSVPNPYGKGEKQCVCKAEENFCICTK